MITDFQESQLFTAHFRASGDVVARVTRTQLITCMQQLTSINYFNSLKIKGPLLTTYQSRIF